MESEALICPFCGAPYRKVIPSGSVQVRCTYCGGLILVPRRFGGEMRRCPNHPDALAVGLCNDCGESFCDSCLTFYEVEHATLHLCPTCFKTREANKATMALIVGVLVFLGGIFFIGLAPNPEGGLASSFIFIGLFALPFISWGVYRTTHLPRGFTLKERDEAIRKEMEFRNKLGSQVSPSELYSRLLTDMQSLYGPVLGTELLERRISYYALVGKSRREAIIKLAEEQGY